MPRRPSGRLSRRLILRQLRRGAGPLPSPPANSVAIYIQCYYPGPRAGNGDYSARHESPKLLLWDGPTGTPLSYMLLLEHYHLVELPYQHRNINTISLSWWYFYSARHKSPKLLLWDGPTGTTLSHLLLLEHYHIVEVPYQHRNMEPHGQARGLLRRLIKAPVGRALFIN